jgi:6-phosphofructokinase 1
MRNPDIDFTIPRLGAATVASPMSGVRFVSDDERVLSDVTPEALKRYQDRGAEPPSMELAGPRQQIFFDPARLACGIVTCGGLCP